MSAKDEKDHPRGHDDEEQQEQLPTHSTNDPEPPPPEPGEVTGPTKDNP